MTRNSDQIGMGMSEADAKSLLTATGHGVLSLAERNRGYGIPVSFGYDPSADRFVFEFLNIGESKKEAFVQASDEVTLTVYEFEGRDSWASAIVTGTIHAVDAPELSEGSVASFVEQGAPGAEDIRWGGANDLERKWYALRPTEITGRRREE